MLTHSYLIAAQTTYLGACVAADDPPVVLIPDLHSRQSHPGRVLPPLSECLERRFGHCTLTI